MTELPPNHPLRIELNNEVHARPPEPMRAPMRMSYIVLLIDLGQRDAHWRKLDELARRYCVTPPPPDATHFSADFGAFRLKFERHAEFVRYSILLDGLGEDPFAHPAINLLPPTWVGALPGQLMVAAHVAMMRPDPGEFDPDAIARRWFTGNVLIGSNVAGGAATALTDFHIHADGFSRFLVLDNYMVPLQAGRIVQRLLEIETYRIMALLALPVARDLSTPLTRSEAELNTITAALVDATDADEPVLLDHLTRLESGIESRRSASAFRFSAAAAYYELVQRRIDELREDRLAGLQTLREFTERRLAPAMNTCRAVAGRLDKLSSQIAQATQLLSTRVDITSERQNRALLESMNRRAQLQLRLQQTVETLSVAAMTYYIVGLVGYAAKAIKAAGAPIDIEIAMGLSMPIVAGFAFWGLSRIRRLMQHDADAAKPKG